LDKSIKCTICGDEMKWDKPHQHNPNGSPIDEVEDLEKIFEDDSF